MTDNSSPKPKPEEEVVVPSVSPSDALEDYSQMLREKILFGLVIYPHLSPSMLHVFLGTATSTHVWKPILNELISEGLVTKEEITLTSPHDRTQTYTVLSRSENSYAKPKYTLDTNTDTNDTNEEGVVDNSNS